MEWIGSCPRTGGKHVKLEIEDRAYRHPIVVDERVEIEGYPGRIREVAALNPGENRPLLLTNDTLEGVRRRC